MSSTKGWIIGFVIGRGLVPVAWLILGAAFVIVAFVFIIGDLSAIIRGDVTFVRDASQWQRAWNTEVIETDSSSSVVEYYYTVDTMIGEFPGEPRGTVTRHNPDDPSQVGSTHPDYTDSWLTTSMRSFTQHDDFYTFEYDIFALGRAILPGKPGDREEIGRGVTMFYDRENPSHIAREVKDFLGIMVIPGFQLLIGGALIVLALRLMGAKKKS